MTNFEIRENAREKVKGKRGVLILALVIVALISAVGAVPYFGSFVTLILSGPLTLGFVGMAIMVAEGKTPKIENLFDGFKNFVNSFVTYLLVSIYTFLWALLIIPAFIKPFSYSMTFYILRDNPEMTASEAITKSREMMDGNKWKLFCLYFSFIGWFLLGILTLGILYLWLIPYVKTAEAEFYLDLRGDKKVVNDEYVDINSSTVRCPLCGAENDADSKFCTRCGEELKKEEVKIFCPLCGSENDADSKFCVKCGNKLKDE